MRRWKYPVILLISLKVLGFSTVVFADKQNLSFTLKMGPSEETHSLSESENEKLIYNFQSFKSSMSVIYNPFHILHNGSLQTFHRTNHFNVEILADSTTGCSSIIQSSQGVAVAFVQLQTADFRQCNARTFPLIKDSISGFKYIIQPVQKTSYAPCTFKLFDLIERSLLLLSQNLQQDKISLSYDMKDLRISYLSSDVALGDGTPETPPPATLAFIENHLVVYRPVLTISFELLIELKAE